MADDEQTKQPTAAAEPAVARGTYEVLRERLLAQARLLRERANQLNTQRLETFGGMEMAVVGAMRVRTANNCVPRDIVEVGPLLLFGYNVFIGLKTETDVSDVFSLHRFDQKDDTFACEPVSGDASENFLADAKFVADFKELYRYYKATRLLQLRPAGEKILAVFQTGASLKDLKVFRWALDRDGKVTYVDNRGERDHAFPPSHDFEWTPTTRDDFVFGRFPHVSIRNEVFVETIGGDLTVKVENNTEDGLGIYREPVDDSGQGLDDAAIHWASVGSLILLKIQPYQEKTARYLVFNRKSKSVQRIDAIGQACLQLPEDQGIIFPGGYYLENGETKSFEGNIADMEFLRMLRAPNGEDVLYVFYERDSGRSILLPYNLIRKEVRNVIHASGYCFFDDGRLVVFRSDSPEPTRVHPMQVWQTPFCSDEQAAAAPSSGSFLEKIGNADLVRGISDALGLCHMIERQTPSVQVYSELIASAARMADAYHWIGNAETGDLLAVLREVRSAGELMVHEFEKVQSLQSQARKAVEEAERNLAAWGQNLALQPPATVSDYVDALASLRKQRGQIITLREQRYADLARIAELEAKLLAELDTLSARAVEFLSAEQAVRPYFDEITALEARIDGIERAVGIAEVALPLEKIGAGLDLLMEVVGALKIDDATVRTRILESIAEVLGAVNRVRALLAAKRKSLLSVECVAEFGAQFKLFQQSFSGALALAETPEKCDEQLARLLLQLEDLEGRFGELDELVQQLATKRDDVYEAFTSKKQTLVDARQRQTQRMVQAADRILEGVVRRASGFTGGDELNAYFAGDPMIAKVRDLTAQLRQVGDAVKADELEGRLKAARQEASRSLRDRQDLFDGTDVITLGGHRFSVNTHPLELTIVPRDGVMTFHLTGTDYYAAIDDPAFAATRPFWEQPLISETPQVYRSEWLAASMLFDAEEQRAGLLLPKLVEVAVRGGDLLDEVRRYSADRYDEGYERGLHDQDAALILGTVLRLYTGAGLLRFPPRARAVAVLFWSFSPERKLRPQWQRRARSLARLRSAFDHHPALPAFAAELGGEIAKYCATTQIEIGEGEQLSAGAYLFEELAIDPQRFVVSAEALRLQEAFEEHLRNTRCDGEFATDLRELQDDLARRWQLVHAWIGALVDEADETGLAEISRLRPEIEETAALILSGTSLQRVPNRASATAVVDGLLGQHARIEQRRMTIRLDEFLARLSEFRLRKVPAFRRFQEIRHQLLDRERKRLRLEEFSAKVMNTFVRNRLISEVFLPLIGDNLAKQMGSVGEGRRTDQMGMLLLISPPGYGKTTLMEYVANRLGLIFVKANGPALGHGVTSLDPADAPNATARQEVERINFAFEMGSNVLLYVDDIQHTNPELLQKFISLCDAQRKIEGVWNGTTRTYDLRGKRFVVCMAGNPYTESGEKFKIPDMLANRSDVYNLGDILEGKEDVFALSYIENALTANPTLAMLSTREPKDVDLLVRMAGGEAIPTDQLSHDYSSAELEELLSVLRKLVKIQKLLLAVNQQYILSASQDDAFRTEPRFQLQGSYRNMTRLASKVVAVQNDAELEALIDDHYAGEAQTLTIGAEHNLLKLAELRGRMTAEQKARWDDIKRGFVRVQAMGGPEDDPATRVVGQLGLLSDRIDNISRAIVTASQSVPPAAPPVAPEVGAAEVEKKLLPYLQRLEERLLELPGTLEPNDDAVRALPPDLHDILLKMFETVGESLVPVLRLMGKRLTGYDPSSNDELMQQLDQNAKNIELLKEILARLRAMSTSPK